MTLKAPPLYPDLIYTDAVEAMRRYDEVRASGCTVAEVQWLRQTAESQFQSVYEFQLMAMGCNSRKPI